MRNKDISIMNNFKVPILFDISGKICIIEVYLSKYYFKSHLIYKLRYYRQTISNQLDIMVPYVDNWSMPQFRNFMINLCDEA